MRRCFRRRRIIIFRCGFRRRCFCFTLLDRLGLLYRFALNRLTLRYLCGSFKRCTRFWSIALVTFRGRNALCAFDFGSSFGFRYKLAFIISCGAVETSEQPPNSIISTRSAANIDFLIISTSFTASLYEKKQKSSKVQTDLCGICRYSFLG